MNTNPENAPFRIPFGSVGRKLLRIDLPAVADGDQDGAPEASSGGMLDLILRAIRSEPENRRRATRHEAVDPEVWVGWWTGGQFGATQGRLLDVSQGGARIILARRPPRQGAVWVSKELGPTPACARAVVVGYTPAPGGAFMVRLRFETPCPAFVCQAVVSGPSPARTEAAGA